jgi:hypothetical protein
MTIVVVTYPGDYKTLKLKMLMAIEMRFQDLIRYYTIYKPLPRRFRTRRVFNKQASALHWFVRNYLTYARRDMLTKLLALLKVTSIRDC